MKIVSRDITLLDDFHITYLLTTVNNEIRIFEYISGNEQKALKERG